MLIKEGDRITLCLFCHKVLSKEQAERERRDGVACRQDGHVIGTAVCTTAPKTKATKEEERLSPAEKLNRNLAPFETPYRDTQFGPTNRPMGNTD